MLSICSKKLVSMVLNQLTQTQELRELQEEHRQDQLLLALATHLALVSTLLYLINVQDGIKCAGRKIVKNLEFQKFVICTQSSVPCVNTTLFDIYCIIHLQRVVQAKSYKVLDQRKKKNRENSHLRCGKTVSV